MSSLRGFLYQSGLIDFTREENLWAFRRVETDLKQGQEKRIVFKPELAPIELLKSPKTGMEEEEHADVVDRERISRFLNLADVIYLQRQETCLRFRQAIHQIDSNCRLITIGAGDEINQFAEEHLHRISYFFAKKHDLFHFDVGTLITMRDGEPKRRDRIEVHMRMIPGEYGEEAENYHTGQVAFDATGSTAHPRIVEWRSSVPEGELGRFAPDDAQIRLVFTSLKHPFTFYEEYREEFKNYSYSFDAEQNQARINRILKHSEHKKSIDDSDDFDFDESAGEFAE